MPVVKDRPAVVHTKSKAALRRALGKGATLTAGRLWIYGTPPVERVAEVLGEVAVTDLTLEYTDAAWWKSAAKLAGLERLARLVVFTVDGKATQLVRSLAKVLSNLSELRIGLLGNAAVAALASCNLPALDHLAIGGGGYNVRLTEKGVGALVASPLGKQLRTLELGRCEISPAMAEQVVKLKKLERFSASVSEFDQTEAMLRKRFRKGFVVEDEPSFDYLLRGVRGLRDR